MPRNPRLEREIVSLGLRLAGRLPPNRRWSTELCIEDTNRSLQIVLDLAHAWHPRDITVQTPSTLDLSTYQHHFEYERWEASRPIQTQEP